MAYYPEYLQKRKEHFRVIQHAWFGSIRYLKFNLALKAKFKNWNLIYDLTIPDRALLVEFIRADVVNHQMLVRNTNPQPAVIELIAIHRLAFQDALLKHLIASNSPISR